MLIVFETPHTHRLCRNCVRYNPHDQWSGDCERHEGATEPDDTCPEWDGE